MEEPKNSSSLLFVSRTEDEVLPVLSSCKFRRQLPVLDLLYLFFICYQSVGTAIISQLTFYCIIGSFLRPCSFSTPTVLFSSKL